MSAHAAAAIRDTRDYFLPKHEQSEWAMLYGICPKKAGEILRYTDIATLLGRPFPSLSHSYSPIERVRRELEQQDHLTVEAVTNVGYRIIAPNEHERRASWYHRGGKRKIKRALSVIRATKREDLSNEQQQRIDNIEMCLAHQQQAIKRIDAKVEQIDKLTQAVKKDVKFTQTSLACTQHDMKTTHKRLNQLDRLVETLTRKGLIDQQDKDGINDLAAEVSPDV